VILNIFKRSNHHYLKQMCICSTQVDELMAVAHSKPEEAGCFMDWLIGLVKRRVVLRDAIKMKCN